MIVRVIGRFAVTSPADPEMTQLAVTLNGDRLRGVMAFDTIAGTVICIARDDRGRALQRGRYLELKQAHGHVRCFVRDASADELCSLVRRGLALA
jgi:hypothetical protein